jgi:hypothetical protein
MSRKPKANEHISLGEKAARHDEGVYRSLKDVLKERQQLAESEGATLTTRHFRAVSLFPDGSPSKYIGLET